VSQLILAHGIRVIDLVAQDQERYFGKIFHREEGVELGFRLGKTFVVFGVDEEDDAGNFGEIVTPKAAGCGWSDWCTNNVWRAHLVDVLRDRRL
jgi:hypothetical protein